MKISMFMLQKTKVASMFSYEPIKLRAEKVKEAVGINMEALLLLSGAVVSFKLE